MTFSTIFDLIIIVLACVVLAKSADKMINSSIKLARHFKISEYTISFLVISIATSLPELMVGVVSALDGNPVLSFGNVLGSNVADLSIIIAIPVLVGGAVSTKEMLKNKDLIYTVFFAFLPLIQLLDGKIGTVDSIILILGYVIYMILVLRKTSVLESFLEKFSHVNIYKEVLIFVISTAVLILSANLLVSRVESLSIKSGIPLILIGITITAFGTSLPELVFGLKAIKLKHGGEVVGNVVGSVIANSTLVLGVTGLLNPIPRNGAIGISSTIFLLTTLLFFAVFSITGRRITRGEALCLVFLYGIFILLESILSGVLKV